MDRRNSEIVYDQQTYDGRRVVPRLVKGKGGFYSKQMTKYYISY